MTITHRRLSGALLAPFALMLASQSAAQSVPQASPTSAVADASAGGSSRSSRFGNLELFLGLDGSKQPQDLGINANMGVRLAANLGVPLVRRANFGAQFGAGVNFSDAAVHVLDQIEGTSRRTQTFVTAGLFHQATARLAWALGYDFLHEQYYDDFNLGQVRGQVGYRVADHDEIGTWWTKAVRSDEGVMKETPVRLDPISQVNGFLRHTWPTSARTTVWAGVASHHHNIVFLLPDNSRDRDVVVYGAQLELPLSDRLSITGSGNFLTPTATGTVDAYLGVTFFPGRQRGQMRSSFAPPMIVGNNPEFPVDLSR